MPSLAASDTLCTRCGTCVADCPYAIIALPSNGSAPRYVSGGASTCPACGHCEAVCPTGAIAVDSDGLVGPIGDVDGEAVTAGQMGRHVRMRRSIRRFRKAPVPRETLERLMDVVRYAPTGMNSQTLSWVVVHSAEEMTRMRALCYDWVRHMATLDSPLGSYFDFKAMLAAWEAGVDVILRGAPHMVVVHAHKESMTASHDGIIALSVLDQAAPSFGLGTCWAGIFHIAVTMWPPLLEALALPEGHAPIYGMMVGTPAAKYHRIPKRKALSASWR